MAEHATNLMITPLIAVPGWLGWDAMSAFGAELYGSPGHALPVLSEAGMWLFDFAVIRARRKDPAAAVWPLYAGMAVFAGICAALNFMHGLLGPIPGSIPPGVEAGLVYGLISVSGIIAHQIVELGGRKQTAGKKPATAGVAPPEENVAPGTEGATNAPAGATKGATSESAPAVNGPAAPPVNGGAANAERDRAVAARKRAERENAELRQQLAGALRGNSGKDSGDSGDAADKTAKRGDKKAIMRAYWDAQIAAGNIPTGADLNRVTDDRPDYALGKRYASEWRNELSAEFTGKITGNRQGACTHEEPASTVLAGVACLMPATTAAAPPDPVRAPGEATQGAYAPGRAYAYAPTREGGPRDA
jgi:hypothetical protein